MSFKFMATVTAIIAVVLTVFYGVMRDLVYRIFNVDDGGAVGDFISRGTAVRFFGFAVLFWGFRNASASSERRLLCLAATVVTGVFAALGLAEIFRGFAGGLTWGVVVLEIALFAGFGRLWLHGG